ncbi:hypothetical protein DFH06DRAFT_1397704 [Mycena polygramma]|nr:hypothetical protein DFH06DRAFT_1397704 [Mycena polygramma]
MLSRTEFKGSDRGPVHVGNIWNLYLCDPFHRLWLARCLCSATSFLTLDTLFAFAFDDAPLLRSAALDAAAVLSVTLPWVQLTSLTLRGVSPRQCTPVLAQTISLIHCELWIRTPAFGAGQINDHQPIALPCLKSLVFRNPEGMPVVELVVELLVVPALRSLRVLERLLGQHPVDVLGFLISHSGCQLQEVSIPRTDRTRVPEDSYRKVFPSIPIFSWGPLVET